ncbi:hypothetical protein BofuT4_P111200.1 [Botrytis cinerea T4]|uniref:Uncharacterized protein n=1 Tax=Botryotinia fuckeliana (strain T4) TaxID=999810 RepID=G2Y655_BOTF4|nr:hypothetical protein BofuT4_P111200.1 [Botrytis cinerea T4]
MADRRVHEKRPSPFGHTFSAVPFHLRSVWSRTRKLDDLCTCGIGIHSSLQASRYDSVRHLARSKQKAGGDSRVHADTGWKKKAQGEGFLDA